MSGDKLRVLAEEQAALRRVATLVARVTGRTGNGTALPIEVPLESQSTAVSPEP